MKIPRFDLDSWSEIVDALSKNKLRSFLTAFGIFWGVFMLVLLMGGGRGLESMLGNVFAGFASNSGFMATATTSMPHKGFREGRQWDLELRDIDRVRNSVPEIDILTPTNTRWGISAVRDNKKLSVSITGIYPDYLRVSNPRLKAGRAINDTDIAQERKVCIIGSRVAEELFPGEDVICGQRIQIDGIYYTVIGLSGRTGNGISINGNALTTVEVPFTTLQRAYGLGTKIVMLTYTARPGYQISTVQDKVEAVVKRAHSIHPDDPQAVIKVNAEAMFTLVDNLFNGISILVWMIGLGTLLSGAIGVSNIMMVTVKERTTEIGIRRAIGATPTDILRQILSESMMLTLLAGMSGITLSVLILQVVETAVNASGTTDGTSTFQISFWIAVGAALLIALLGIVAGLAPALRAMHIRPVEAMRSDE
ncbi:MAG: ABC transporter permease [Bacteroidaceae bacterium]|nr:ABC transporter permease [Bacteroidaceae bacterium]